MNTSNTQTNKLDDTVAQDFFRAAVVVSVVLNLATFVSWLAISVA